jgi:hypothetical protein
MYDELSISVIVDQLARLVSMVAAVDPEWVCEVYSVGSKPTD